MVTPKRRIKRAEVRLLSLCHQAANRMPVLYKADGSIEIQTLTKYEAERGELLALGYVPNGTDSQGDTADADAVKSMAYSHMKNGAGLDIQHDGKVLTKDQAFVAESFIVQKGDPRFDGWPGVDATGAWGVLVKIDDPVIREAYKTKALDGVSLFGKAEVEPLDDATTRIVEATIKALQGAKETDVDAKELTTVLTANNEILLAGLVKALTPPAPDPKPAAKPEDPKPDEMIEPVLKVADRGDPAKVKKHLDALKAYRLMKSVNWADPKEVENYYTDLTKTEDPTPDPRVAELQAEIDSILKSTSAPSSAAKPETGEALLKKKARSAADAVNESRGFTAEKK